MWLKVDDGFHSHRKVSHALSLNPTAIALWTVAGSWCGDNLTDGFIPSYQLDRFLPAKHRARPLAAVLVTVGLWDEVTDGWQFHDWHGMNPSRQTVQSHRDAAAERKRKSRAGHSDVTRDETVTGVVTHVGVSRASRGRGDPTRPDLKNNPPISPQLGNPFDTGSEVVPFRDLSRQPAVPTRIPEQNRRPYTRRPNAADRRMEEMAELYQHFVEVDRREQAGDH